MRTALLDLADSAGDPGANGRFDAHDLDEYLAGFQTLAGQIDYGRFDLNGDGVTRNEAGVVRRDRVDLNADRTLGVVTQDLEGLPVRYDERSLSDENILCFAAYSPLWLGPLDEREEKLGLSRCVSPRLEHTFPQRVRAGESNALTISARSLELLDEQGERLPVEGFDRRLRDHRDAGGGAYGPERRGAGARRARRRGAGRGHRHRAAADRRARASPPRGR